MGEVRLTFPQRPDGTGSAPAPEAPERRLDLGRLGAMTLSRIAWLVTVATCLVSAVLLFVGGYQGYGVLALVVGAAAAINVR